MPPSILPHVPTLGLATVLVAAILGSLLLCTWLQDRSHRALLWWGPGYVFAAIGTALFGLRGTIPDLLSFEIANAAVFLAAGCAWAGARTFERRQVSWLAVALPPASWILACQLPFFAADLKLRISVASFVLAAIFLLAAYEIWRGRAEKLVSRWPAIVVMTIYGCGLLARIPTAYLVDLPAPADLFKGVWFGMLALGALIYTITLAFILLALTKERTELVQRRAALLDPLTGLLNRRAFFAEGEPALARNGSAGKPAAALVFDLDGFKQINDRFGHPIGDEVLTRFGTVMLAELRATDFVGRIGGEEFAALLPDCDERQALAAAERIRGEFSRTPGEFGSCHVNSTVSIGLATPKSGQTLSALIADADRAVYRAKAAGRNCVCVFEPHSMVEPLPQRPLVRPQPKAA